MQQVGGGVGLQGKFGLAGFHPRQGEQILGQAAHAGGVFADDFQKFPGVAIAAGIEQRFGVARDGSQGGAKFLETLAMKSRRVFSTRSTSVRSWSTTTAPPPGRGAAITSKLRPAPREVARAVLT